MRFDDFADWVFLIAVMGTLAFPLVMGIAAWVAPPGRRARRLLLGTGAWVAACALATVARLVTRRKAARRFAGWLRRKRASSD